jgi:hypothetical protein
MVFCTVQEAEAELERALRADATEDELRAAGARLDAALSGERGTAIIAECRPATTEK